ncbi:hypothetical protein Golob_013217 [Gossypium lobatum]|uniref:Uncharacterized protein n=1 Tax=Gossypium lobatum TaxID=34289 RepID=A0A7J8LNW5_9ROSI|nr:hypothetical protein [Gossypium lobatum]
MIEAVRLILMEMCYSIVLWMQYWEL